MELKELLDFKTIVIQCHNDPDADAIASGWAVQRWLEHRGYQKREDGGDRTVRLVYSGGNVIRKANLRKMLELLNISIEHVPDQLTPEPDLLLIVDGTYQSGKVKELSGKTIAVIDHHRHDPEEQKVCPALHEVRASFGSCSTIVWDMIQKAEEGEADKLDPAADKQLATALYYGLFMDTNRLEKLPDTDAMDTAMCKALEHRCDKDILKELKTSNLSPKELRIVGRALAGSRYDLNNRCALTEVEPCDTNILGIIGDQMMEVENTDVCVTYCLTGKAEGKEKGAAVSVRSCTEKVLANRIVRDLTSGHGGGHKGMAGGTLPYELYHPAGEDMDEEMDSERAFWYLWERLKRYYRRHGRLSAAVTSLECQEEGKNPLALAEVDLGGVLTVKEVRVMSGKNGLFVAMPSDYSKGRYYDACFPITGQMRTAISEAVLRAYHSAKREAADEAPAPEPDALTPEEVLLYAKVRLNKNEGSTLLGYADVCLENCFVVRDIKLWKGQSDQPELSMPRKKDRAGKEIRGREYVVFLSQQVQQQMEGAVREAYQKELAEKRAREAQ